LCCSALVSLNCSTARDAAASRSGALDDPKGMAALAQDRDAQLRGLAGTLTPASVPSIGVIRAPNRVVLHLCLSFPSILQTRRHFGWVHHEGKHRPLRTEFVRRLAAAIAEARGAGLPFAGIFSASLAIHSFAYPHLPGCTTLSKKLIRVQRPNAQAVEARG
jgi:hypothetical protein